MFTTKLSPPAIPLRAKGAHCQNEFAKTIVLRPTLTPVAAFYCSTLVNSLEHPTRWFGWLKPKAPDPTVPSEGVESLVYPMVKQASKQASGTGPKLQNFLL